nr:MAG TPA: Large Terminase [Caudoviricetes sp.]
MREKTRENGVIDDHPIPIPPKRRGRPRKTEVMAKTAKTKKPRKPMTADEYRSKKMLEQRARCNAAYSIDKEYEEAVSRIDWNRRNKARESLEAFIQTYLVGSLFAFEPEGMMCLALHEMEQSLVSSRPYNIELPRGSGKTTAAEAMCLYLLAYGLRKFLVVISNNQRAAGNILNDLYHIISDGSSVFAQDFPELCIPFVIANGSFRRRQTIRGKLVEISKNATNLQFPCIFDEDGNPLPTSGSVVTCRGMTAGVRGLKVGSLRPDLAILDDLQDSEIARSAEQVDKVLDFVRKDVINLSSGKKLATLMTSTPISADDLCAKIEEDPNWRTTKFRAIIKWPRDIIKHGDNGLWGTYFEKYDAENMSNAAHDGSLDFYKTHRREMDEGAELFSSRFNEADGHISALQALMEKRHLIGKAAFASEMQMAPARESFALDISPSDVAKVIGSCPRATIPEGYRLTVAACDLNVSHAITLVTKSYKPDMSSVVIVHKVFPTAIPTTLSDADYSNRVTAALDAVAHYLASLDIHIDALGVDAGGRNWDVVCAWSRICKEKHGFPACAMAGRASHKFNAFSRSRLRDAQNRTVLCGDPAEHARAGSGQKYMFFDSDFYREKVQRALLTPLGGLGGCQLYNADPAEHVEYATQVCNERIRHVRHLSDGRDEYEWISKEPHDFLDASAMADAIAGSYGLSGLSTTTGESTSKKPAARRRFVRRRIRFV